MPKLHAALLEGSYRPGEIRWALIPKPDGGSGAFGIPNVIDRLVEEAAVDDGVGFDPSILRRQARNGHVGLAIVRERVLQLGGNLEIESARGLGTTVRVTLPLTAAD